MKNVPCLALHGAVFLYPAHGLATFDTRFPPSPLKTMAGDALACTTDAGAPGPCMDLVRSDSAVVQRTER
jgi:hypothetical protein